MSSKTLLKIVLPACLFIVLCIQCIIIFLPDISKYLVQSALGPLPGNQSLDFTVSRLGGNETQINDISLGEDIHLDTLRFSYHMDAKNMIRGDELVISGLNITLHVDEKNRVQSSGFLFPLNKDEAKNRNKGVDPSAPAFDINAFESYFPYLPEHIVLKNSTVFIKSGKDRLCIPVEADVRIDRDKRLGDMKLTILPMNQRITLGATGDFLQGPVQMKISAERLYPDMLLAMVPHDGQRVSKFCGPVDFTVETKDFSTFYFELNDLGLESGPHLNINFPEISGVLFSDKTAMTLKADGPVQITSPGIDLGPFRFKISSQIVSGTVTQFSLTLQNEIYKAWDITPEQMALPLSTVNFFDQIQLVDPQFRLFVSGNPESQTGALAFSGTGLKLFRNNKANHSDVLNISGLQINTEFGGNFVRPQSLKHIKFDALIDKIAFQKNKIKINTSRLEASSDAAFTLSDSTIVLDNAIDVNLVCDNAKIVSKEISAFVSKAGITGKIEKSLSSGLCVQLTPFLDGADITLKDKDIRAQGIYVELPVTYPFKDLKTVGRAGAEKIILQDKIAPTVAAKVVQTSDLAMDILGTVTHTGFPDLVINFSARAGLNPAMTPFIKGHAAINQVSITQKRLASFIPGISGVGDLNFDISARADFSYTNQKIDSSAQIQVSNGMLNCVESGFSVSGISADLHFNDLMIPETLPGQYINIAAVNAGHFNCNNGKIRFSLEDGTSVHVENLKFNWCNGIVTTEAFRLPSDDNAIHLTLYCDRLEMEKLFHQLGAFDAQGGGTLSGRIPMVIKNNEIAFDKGFLFSTPGEGGRIFIKGLDGMLDAIPKHTREFSQLDLAGEALKNFEYKWVKLKLNSHGDTLGVNMQLEGKPSAALPFEYNRQLNSFVRVDAQSPGSNFQGIKLDVNLTLPFNQVIQFGNNLNRIMNP
ncbi:MAG: carboxylate transporter [Desulfobacter postgatei]|uniref:Carboxylate transporter n=1 Tax=Desulfobacter postgatei TaxID=2293 RepID=A0A2G6MTW1_9BACT|nr:MAG: carboxylate transporter [Desulfobacter postgatei]